MTSSKRTIGYFFKRFHLSIEIQITCEGKELQKKENSQLFNEDKKSRLTSQNHLAYDRQQFNQWPSKSRNSTLLLMLGSAFGIGSELTLSKLHYFCDK